MELYPLKFAPILKNKIWGGDKIQKQLLKSSNSNQVGESWEISGVEGDISIVSNGFLQENSLNELLEIYMADLVGENIYKKFGNEFPLLFKFIDAQDDLSIQVHPDDQLAKKRHNAYGKTEMWYVLDAEPNSEIIVGFNKELDKSSYLKCLEVGEIKGILNFEKTKSGDVFFIPAGRVHAIGKGILLVEIQQTSDITYRIYDWDRKDDEGQERELHTELALDALDFKTLESYKTEYYLTKNESSNLADTPFFTTNILDVDKVMEMDYSLLDSFIVLICVEGEIDLLMGDSKESIKKGETVLIPAIADFIKIVPKPIAKLLEVYIKPDKV